ncbi:unnamed protein product [Paramecium octaurelia]|uniref:WD40-repeat-containing domain n=1 Tax=Paramecium octaurelia TaxID=43137 RepID=A0A8S1YKK5_PAROT|nr:unnamed protein product [Paramecium octaurelia]
MIEKEEELVCSMNHKLPIYMVVCDKNRDKNQRLLCNECMDNLESNLNNVMSFKKVSQIIEENQKKNVEQVEQIIMMNIKKINLLQETLYLLRSQIIQQIDQIIGNTNEWIKCLQDIGQQNANYSFFEQLDNLINQIEVGEIDYRPLNNQISKINHSQNQKIIKKLNDFKSFELIKKCEELLKNSNTTSQHPFTYNLIQNHKIQQSEYCYAIAINKDNSIVLAGCDNKIKVFEFKQEQLKLIQLLTEHKDNVTTLNFMKKSTQFISGSMDKQIIIWWMDQKSQWICQYKLNQNSYQINCLLLNNNEDLIISGSSDKTIKFWTKKNDWTCSQTITDSTKSVVALSLNEKQNRVISCGDEMLFILIIEQQQQDQKWNVIQKITVDYYGYRICFINDNVFTFQPRLKEQMYVYEINIHNNSYSKTTQIAVKSDSEVCDYYFPQQYIKSKYLLINKNGKNVNLIRKNQNGEFITQLSIQFGHNYIYGSMSENGDYLMTWDYQSKQIQIRKYQQL